MTAMCQPQSRFRAGGLAIARPGEICVRFEGRNVLIQPASSHRRATVRDRRTSAFPESPMLASEAADCRKARTRCRTPRSPSYASTPQAQSRRWSFRPYRPAPQAVCGRPHGYRNQAAGVIGNNPEAKPRMTRVRMQIISPSAGDRRIPAKGSGRLGRDSETATPA
jgi:hypothetical protein